MLVLPIEQPTERRLSDIDRFCIQTREEAATATRRRVRFVASMLGAICLLLTAALALALWQGHAVARERDALIEELRAERAALVKASLAANDAEMSAATSALDLRVRSDLVDQRMLEQQRRELELEQRALEVERQRLIDANCITPRSIIGAGL